MPGRGRRQTCRCCSWACPTASSSMATRPSCCDVRPGRRRHRAVGAQALRRAPAERRCAWPRIIDPGDPRLLRQPRDFACGCSAPRQMNHLTDALHIPDTQSERDERHLAIQRVGVKDVRYPLQLAGGRCGAEPPRRCGTWTWRCRPRRRAPTCRASWPGWTALDRRWTPPALRQRQAPCCSGWAPAKAASRPASASSCASARRCRAGRACSTTRAAGSPRPAGLTVGGCRGGVPVKSLCPCSKEISDYGAHNQRSLVTIRVELLQPIEWHELVRFAEDQASSEIWPMLKRVRREVGHRARLREPQVRRGPGARRRAGAERRCAHRALPVDVENFESIHNHSAYARIER
jgi:GTP cyclohydrolase I